MHLSTDTHGFLLSCPSSFATSFRFFRLCSFAIIKVKADIKEMTGFLKKINKSLGEKVRDETETVNRDSVNENERVNERT